MIHLQRSVLLTIFVFSIAGVAVLHASDEPAEALDVRVFRIAYLLPHFPSFPEPPKTELVWKPEPAKTLSLIDILEKMKSSRGNIFFVKSANALVVRDTSAILDKMQAVIDKLDQPPPPTELEFTPSDEFSKVLGRIRQESMFVPSRDFDPYWVADTEGGG